MRTELFGHPVDVLSMDDTVEKIHAAMHSRTPIHHVALNVAKLVELGYNDELRDDVHAADIVGIDGMGILLALRMNAVDVPERVAGIDLMQRVLALCAAEGFKPYFLGAEPRVVARAAQVACENYPGLELAGVRDGYFNPEDEASIVEEIKRSGADCLFVGMPTPRKERFLAKFRKQLDIPFIMGVGGSFDVMAGKVQRAPRLMQKLGLEWAYRVYQEPRRMWWRYARTNTLFAAMIGSSLAERVANALTLAAEPKRAEAGISGSRLDALPPVDVLARSVADSGSERDLAGRGTATSVSTPTSAVRLPWRVMTDILIGIELASVVVASQVAIWLYGIGFSATTLRDVDYVVPSIICAILTGRQLNEQGHLTLNAVLQRQNGEWRKIVYALAQGFLLTLAIAYLLQVSADYSRGWLLQWFILSAVFLAGMRYVNRRILRWMLRTRAIERRVVVLSAGSLPPDIVACLLTEPGMTLARHYSVDPAEMASSAQTSAQAGALSPIDQLVKRLMDDGVEEIVIVDRGFSGEQLAWVVRQLTVLPITVLVQPASLETGLPILGVERVGRGSVLKVSGKPVNNWGLVAKNTFDFVFAAIGLVVLAPLFAAIAIAIKLDSAGPVFFRQRRHGFYENQITVFKFRTMNVLEDSGDIKQARDNDPRVTRVGWFLRRTSLDELPQLINVMRGEMSLVGPRPHALQHNDMFRQCVNRYTARHRVKPGITGLAQINGLRGECKTLDKMRKRVEMDIYYIDNWSFWLDLRILVLTPLFGLIGRNAY